MAEPGEDADTQGQHSGHFYGHFTAFLLQKPTAGVHSGAADTEEEDTLTRSRLCVKFHSDIGVFLWVRHTGGTMAENLMCQTD